MSTSSTRQLYRQTVLFALLAGAPSCVETVQVPLAVPLPAVGGSRPATPQGLQFIGEFGDGLWGQEQERAEMAGGGVGFAMRDRFEFSASGYGSTRTVQDSFGNDHNGANVTGVRGKVRLGDLVGGRASIGVHLAHMSSQRKRPDVQDERLTAWDVALPLTFYPVGDQFIDHRWGVYAAPRLVFQRLEDRMTLTTSSGTLAAALLGVVARWRHVAVTGEMNLAHTPSMRFGNTTFQGRWILLPMASVSGILPIGD